MCRYHRAYRRLFNLGATTRLAGAVPSTRQPLASAISITTTITSSTTVAIPVARGSDSDGIAGTTTTTTTTSQHRYASGGLGRCIGIMDGNSIGRGYHAATCMRGGVGTGLGCSGITMVCCLCGTLNRLSTATCITWCPRLASKY